MPKSNMRANEDRRRNGHVLVWDQVDIHIDEKKSKSKKKFLKNSNFSFIIVIDIVNRIQNQYADEDRIAREIDCDDKQTTCV